MTHTSQLVQHTILSTETKYGISHQAGLYIQELSPDRTCGQISSKRGTECKSFAQHCEIDTQQMNECFYVPGVFQEIIIEAERRPRLVRC